MALSRQQKLSRYKGFVDTSQKWRKDEGFDSLWNKLIDMYRGKQFPHGADDEDRIAINLAFSTINVIAPSIAVNHPKVGVAATKPEDEDKAVIAEAVLNYWWRHFDFKSPFREAVVDFLIIGHGWVKIGYLYEEEQVARPENEMAEELAQRQGILDEAAAANPELAADMPTDEELQESIVTAQLVATEDRPFVERVSPFDIFVDPDATNLQNMGWIAQRIVRPLEEARKDKRYNRSVRRMLQADGGKADDGTGSDAKRRIVEVTPWDRVTVWEFYDIRTGEMCVFSDGADGFLVDPQPAPYAFGHPFEFIANYQVPDHFYPIGDLEMLVDLQGELNKTRSQMMNHRKKYARKYLVRESAFESRGLAALASDQDNVVVPVIDDNRPMQDIVAPVPIQPLSADMYNYSEIIEGDLNTVSGISEYARGATPEIRRTATEAAIIQDASNARAADKLARIELAIGRIARKVLQLAQQYLTAEQVARVTGVNNMTLWVPFNHEDIEGEFDFEVEGGSTQPNNETFRRQQAMEMLGALGPFIGTVLDPHAILRHALQFGFGIKNPDKFMMQPQAPMVDPATGAPMDPMAQQGLPPGMAPPMGAPPEAAPFPGPADPFGGTDSVPPEILAQLVGQVGLPQ